MNADPVGMTPTCQPFTAAALTTALEACWTAIRDWHPEVPDVVLVLGSGSGKPGQLKLGHFAAARWQHGDNRLSEVLVSGEGLTHGAVAVLGTLLHEAAHGLASARTIKDTSRQGRFHNRKFQALAAELGLTVTKDPRIGWSVTTVPGDTAGKYGPQLGFLGEAMSAYRHLDPTGPTRKSNNNGVTAYCDCDRRIRASLKVLLAGPIICGVCDAKFLPDEEDGVDP